MAAKQAVQVNVAVAKMAYHNTYTMVYKPLYKCYGKQCTNMQKDALDNLKDEEDD